MDTKRLIGLVTKAQKLETELGDIKRQIRTELNHGWLNDDSKKPATKKPASVKKPAQAKARGGMSEDAYLARKDRILRILATKPMSVSAVQKKLGDDYYATKNALERMAKEKLVTRGKGVANNGQSPTLFAVT